MNTKKNETDVLIIGAGPVGLVMACELFRRGIRCRIIDKELNFSHSSRALGIHARTQEVLEHMGVIDKILAAGAKAKGITTYDRDRAVLQINLHHVKRSLYPFQLILPQSQTEAILNERLTELGGTVEQSQELLDIRQEEDALVAIVKKAGTDTGKYEEIRTRWLIGCDGARSLVRKILAIPFEGSTAPEEFLLADVDLDWNRTRDTTHGWLTNDGLFAVFPLPNGQWRLFVTVKVEEGQKIPQASVDVFQKVMVQYAGDTTTRISNPTWTSNFRVNYRMVTAYRKGRAFLAGDAAHIHSPFGGQGMNVGIQDAHNLAWKLALVLQGKAKESLLETYQEERMPIARYVLNGAQASTGIVTARNPVMRWLRDHIVVPIVNLDAIQSYLAQEMSQLTWNYRRSSLSHLSNGNKANIGKRPSWRKAPHAGDRALPGACLTYPEKVMTDLSHVFHEPESHLLLFTGLAPTEKEYAHLAKLASNVQALSAGSIKIYTIIAGSKEPAYGNWHGPILLDPSGTLHTIYGARRQSLYFIRPDGYIGFRSQPAHSQALRDYLSTIFSSVGMHTV